MGRAPDIYDGTKTHTHTHTHPTPISVSLYVFWQSKVNGTVGELRLPLGPALSLASSSSASHNCDVAEAGGSDGRVSCAWTRGTRCASLTRECRVPDIVW